MLKDDGGAGNSGGARWRNCFARVTGSPADLSFTADGDAGPAQTHIRIHGNEQLLTGSLGSTGNLNFIQSEPTRRAPTASCTPSPPNETSTPTHSSLDVRAPTSPTSRTISLAMGGRLRGLGAKAGSGLVELDLRREARWSRGPTTSPTRGRVTTRRCVVTCSHSPTPTPRHHPGSGRTDPSW